MEEPTVSERKIVLKKMTLYAACLVLVSLVQYSYSFKNEFVWDATSVFQRDPTIRDFSFLPSYFFGNTGPHTYQGDQIVYLNYYRPVMKVIHLLEYQAFGPHPWGYNAVSILLNAVLVVQAFVFVAGATGNVHAAFLASLLYAVNPSRVEAISWSYSDSYLFGAFFCLLALILYQKKRHVLASASFALALLSHECTIVLPAIVVLYAYFIDAEERTRPFVRAAPFVLITVIYMLIRRAVIGPLPLSEEPILAVINTVAVIIKRYVKIFFLPDAMITIYPNEVFYSLSPETIISYAVLLVVAGVAVFLWFRRRAFLFWYLWFFVWASISFNVGQFGSYLIADKLLNIAALGFCVLGALFAFSLSGVRKAVALVLVVVLLVFHSTYTFARTRYWRNDVVYFEKALEFTPDFFLAMVSLARSYILASDYDKAIRISERAISIHPESSGAYNNLGYAYFAKGERGSAAKAFERAITYDPSLPEPYMNMGRIMEADGNTQKAIQYYRLYLNRAAFPAPEVGERLRQLENPGR